MSSDSTDCFIYVALHFFYLLDYSSEDYSNYFQGAKKDPKAGAKGAPTKNPKKKEGGGGGKAKKKKWSKGKTR